MEMEPQDDLSLKFREPAVKPQFANSRRRGPALDPKNWLAVRKKPQ